MFQAPNNLLRIIRQGLTVLLFSFPTILFALPADSEQTIHIVADSSTYSYKTGTNTYEGNVKIDQGTTKLTADRVVTRYNKQHRIQEVIAYGITKPAEYSAIPKTGDTICYARAKIIKFYPFKSTVILDGNVIVTQGKNSFQGPLMIYNSKDQVFTAPASKIGRATIVIEPNQLKL